MKIEIWQNGAAESSHDYMSEVVPAVGDNIYIAAVYWL